MDNHWEISEWDENPEEEDERKIEDEKLKKRVEKTNAELRRFL